MGRSLWNTAVPITALNGANALPSGSVQRKILNLARGVVMNGDDDAAPAQDEAAQAEGADGPAAPPAATRGRGRGRGAAGVVEAGAADRLPAQLPPSQARQPGR